jgi:hypothetical protein
VFSFDHRWHERRDFQLHLKQHERDNFLDVIHGFLGRRYNRDNFIRLAKHHGVDG